MAAIQADEKSSNSSPTYELDDKRRGSVANVAYETIKDHSHDADVAMRALEQLGDIEIDEATSKRLLKKIDWNLMPVRGVPVCSVSSDVLCN